MAFLVFRVIPKISRRVSELEEKALRQKLADNNESNKYGLLIVVSVLMMFLVVALIS